MGIDIWEVVDAASTKPFGFMRFEPGPGMGGHCLPVDPFYLALEGPRVRPRDRVHRARRQGQPAACRYFCLEKIERALNDAGKPVKGSRILDRSASPTRPGVGDIRESPALKIIELLRERGADVAYHDPHVPELPEHGLAAVDLDDALDGADLAVIVTAHPELDHARSSPGPPLVVDFRGITRDLGADNVVLL